MTTPDQCTPRHDYPCPSSTPFSASSGLPSALTTSLPPSYSNTDTSASSTTNYYNYPSPSSPSFQSTSSGTTPAFAQTASAPSTTVLSASPTSSATPGVVDAVTSSPNAGAIAGGVIGGVVLLVCVALGTLLYLRARKRKRTAPSSEFMNSLRAGDTPILRLDSGAEYTPAIPEKGGYAHYSSVPLPFRQDSYYTSPPMQNMRFPDIMMSDIPSSRPSVDKPLHPQRFSEGPTGDSYTDKRHHVSTSIGSRRELWNSDAEITPSDLPARQSLGQGHDTLDFATRYSVDDSPSRPFSTTPRDSALHEVTGQQSPPRVLSPSLQPLRRQEDP